MKVRVARLFAHDKRQPAQNRLSSLKIRTLLTALTALACGFFGARLVAAPLSKLGAWSYGLAMQQSTLPMAHVPQIGATDFGYWLPQAGFVLVSALAIIGFSAGAFGRTRARIVMIPPLLLGIATAFVIPATSQWMHMLPSQLERDIMHGRFDAAESALEDAGAPPAIKQYVKAQIALRANDEQALRIYGEPVLKLADQWAYSAPEGIDPLALKAVVQFEPEVIHALDLALNREAQTQVGIQWEQEHALRSPIWRWVEVIAKLCAGLALLAASIGLVVLWNRMRRRVRIIQAEIMPVETPEWVEIAASDDTAAAPQSPAAQKFETMSEEEKARAEAMSAHLGLSLQPKTQRAREADPAPNSSASKPNSAPASLPKHAAAAHPSPSLAKWSRRSRNAALGVALVWSGQFFYAKTIQHIGGSESTNSESGGSMRAGTHPCKYVGEWTSARDQSVYKVTLKDNGDFRAEPIARGRYSDTVISGTWSVRENRMEWISPSHPGTVDSNPIKDATEKSFTLVEMSGELTRFNLIQAAKSSKCSP